MTVLTKTAAAAATLALALSTAAGADAQTLKTVKDRGTLVCGVSEGLPGFSAKDDKGAWKGFDVDFCRALAAAIFDDAGKVSFVPLDADKRFAALQAGEVDVLSRNSTWTLAREAALKIVFPAVTYYDGQGFMMRKSPTVQSPLDFKNVKVCVREGTTNLRNAADYFRANDIQATLVPIGSARDAVQAYAEGRCEVLTSDVSQLHAERAGLQKPGDHVILPDVISKEPLGPAVRQGDDQWALLVKWVHFAMLSAEELGVTAETLDRAQKSEKPDIRRLVGTDGDLGAQLGVGKDWVVRIVRNVGTYGDVFERNVGVATPLGIPRGLNHLWTTGGIQYAPPLQ
ncbi:amino acid ABC transporter substrate-binding protein [Rhodoplanes roseus]|uniref:Amino acid ABC transporter substrate-bindnig protein n=1 Tax=Rhodoplanes roseus TaxID=29409 RepID=A0A327L413_9BRAD|nr:amino acid ABC transporter substrate-binding protein [Rhodoplanes roseus]RAI45810.1 amino acid ABC transporter substrate-bindnig protein [Rhodoplanes roseus]